MKKILIIQNKRIGDVLISSVIANNYKAKYPDSIINLMAYDFTHGVIQNNPNIDKIISINEKELKKYYSALDEKKLPLSRGYFVTDDDKIRREAIMRVMCDLSLDYAAMSQKLGINFASHFEREIESLAEFEADGLVKRLPTGLEVTDTGHLFIRNIAMCFDNTLAPVNERKHSRTV